MKFSTVTVITTFLQTAVKTSGQEDNVNATNIDVGADTASDVINIDFMFPIVPGVGALQTTMDEMVADFNELHPDINVNAIYAGSYGETYDKVIARIDEQDPPAVAVLNVNEMVDLNAMGAIIPLNKYVKEAGGWLFLDDYYTKMFESEELVETEAGKPNLMGWPMMRSTPVLYYNEDMLNEFGVDPPRIWDELIATAKKTTTDTNKGLGLPDTWSDWIYGAFSRQGGTQVIEERDWETVTFDSKENANALAVWEKLSKDESIPVPLTPWSEAISNFLNGDFPMLYFTTGGISKIKAGANFTWNAVYCPAGTHGYGVTLGGGDFHIFSGVPKSSQDAAWKLIKFLTTPDNAAKWSVASGYIAVNKKAYDTELMQEVLKETPQYAVARDQLNYGHPQMMSKNIGQVRQVLNDNLNALVAGDKTIAEVQADGQSGMVAAIGAPTSAPVPTEGDDATSASSHSLSTTLTSVLWSLLMCWAVIRD